MGNKKVKCSCVTQSVLRFHLVSFNPTKSKLTLLNNISRYSIRPAWGSNFLTSDVKTSSPVSEDPIVSKLAKAARRSEHFRVRPAALQICSLCAVALLAAARNIAAGAALLDQGLVPWFILLFLFPSCHLVAETSTGMAADHPARSQA